MSESELAAALEAIHCEMRDLRAELRRYAERHDAQHQALSESSQQRRLETEQRLTRLESAVQTRSALGVVGLAVSYMLQLLGLPRPTQ